MFNELYDIYILQNIPRNPRPSPESLKTVSDQMAETDPRVTNLKPEQFIDGRFFAELEKDGFIQKLWKGEWGERELGVQRSSSAA